ncbi:Uma2 family endonuclease [Allocatelliglobosispora scoriae]|uniref:Uma2 family endonuclease n=1 Tax=Allocatelliglobosispora scoriae TaxID=643052 RepID=A0A841BXA9_9ACTN|nr:Uma2 family endonuclease [Allocatelliglobosispora scoriae]MBB5871392.1 Uma2 family endonuclease [Allocatelliglobosispora scoriae]
MSEDDSEVVEMTAAPAGRVGWVTEEDFWALGETPERFELLDGTLIVPPSATGFHQMASLGLANALRDAVHPGQFILEAVNVRLRPGAIVIPDVVIVLDDYDKLYFEPEQVVLVAEIVSPSNAAHDRVTKLQLYAKAGIPLYIIAERTMKGLHLQLLQLVDGYYVEVSRAGDGERLTLTDPLRTVEIDPATLLP